jgi:hypothetical protein
MMCLAVQIVRFVDGHFPGFVECEFKDAEGLSHIFVDKVPIVTAELLDGTSSYPQAGAVPCEVVARWADAKGRELVRISLKHGITTSDGKFEFVVLSNRIEV